MPGSFQTGCASIDLSGPPWNVTTVVKLFVLLRPDGSFGLYHNEACTNEYGSAGEMPVWENVSTGLYFYIASGSPVGTLFCDGLDHRPLPIQWLASDTCPQTVTYGKIRENRQAFSMSDLATGSLAKRLPFDLMVETPNHGITSVLKNLGRHLDLGIDPVDPTIVEKGEEPPGGGTET